MTQATISENLYEQLCTARDIPCKRIPTGSRTSPDYEIVTTPGLDGVYIGPSDLSLSLGFEPKLDFTAPEVLDAVTRICNAAQAAGIVAGIHCQTPDHAKKMLDVGFQMVTIWGDGGLLASAAKQAVDAMREG